MLECQVWSGRLFSDYCCSGCRAMWNKLGNCQAKCIHVWYAACFCRPGCSNSSVNKGAELQHLTAAVCLVQVHATSWSCRANAPSRWFLAATHRSTEAVRNLEQHCCKWFLAQKWTSAPLLTPDSPSLCQNWPVAEATHAWCSVFCLEIERSAFECQV